MKKLATLIIVLFVFQISTSQNYNFGKVSKEELEEKFNPLDSSANATYLYKYRKTFYEYHQQSGGFQLITDVHERIKIYNQEGFDYVTREVNLYKSGSTREDIRGLKANTYNLVGNKIEDTKLKKDGIFENEKSRYNNQTKFTMPNIKVGSVIEYKYKIVSPFITNVDEFELQHDIPIKKLEAKFSAPEYYNFKVNTKGFLRVIPKNETKNDIITINSKSRSLNGFSGANTTFSSEDIEYKKNTSTYSLSNIPALKEEPYVNNINNYRSAVKFELSYSKFPNELINYYSTTWDDVVKTIYESPNFGTQLDKSSFYKDDIDALIGSVSDQNQKATLIFNYVKTKVKWNGYYGKYVNDGVRKAYKDQVGNVAEINLLLTSMLRYSGLNANPVLVSTRNNGVPLFPTREGYNYVISCIEMPNGVILLDASSKYSTPNVLPLRVLNWQGRIIRKQGSSTLINLYPKVKSKNTTSMSVTLDQDGNIEGRIRNVKTTHEAMLYRQKYNDADKDDYLERLENKYDGMEITDFEVKNSKDLSKPIIEDFKFSKQSQSDIIGNNMYVNPLFFLRTIENPFKSSDREFPVDFGHPSSIKFNINIKLPVGYKVEAIPESRAFALPDNLGSFRYNIATKNGSVQLIVFTEINESIIISSYYDALKEFYNQIVTTEAEQIVLTKM